MATKKKKFSELSGEEKFSVLKATISSIVIALIAVAFAVNIFSCQVGPVALATVAVENKTNWKRVVENSNWTLSATNVTESDSIPEIWYCFSTFHIDPADSEEDNSSVHLVTVTKDDVSNTANLLLQEDGYGTLRLSSDCVFDVHIIRPSGSSNPNAEFLMRLKLDDRILELIPAD